MIVVGGTIFSNPFILDVFRPASSTMGVGIPRGTVWCSKSLTNGNMNFVSLNLNVC